MPAKKWNVLVTGGAGCDNFTDMKIAEMVREAVGNDVTITITLIDDNRSYYVSSEKIRRQPHCHRRRPRPGPRL